jgi:hypothetical protein
MSPMAMTVLLLWFPWRMGAVPIRSGKGLPCIGHQPRRPMASVAYEGGGPSIGGTREILIMQADGLSRVRLAYETFDDTEPDWAGAS